MGKSFCEKEKCIWKTRHRFSQEFASPPRGTRRQVGGPLPPIGAVTGLPCLFCGLRAMEARWPPALACGRNPTLFICVFKAKRRRLSEDEIRFIPPSPRPGGAFSVVVDIWRCVFSGSHRIRLVLVFGGYAWIQFLYVCICVFPGWTLLIYASLQWWRLLFWCVGPAGS